MEATQLVSFELSFEPNAYSAIPYLDQWLGVWMIEPNFLSQMVATIQAMDLRSHLASVAGQNQKVQTDLYTVEENVAIVRLRGPLQKHASSFNRAGSTVLARKAVRLAARDPSVGAILLDIESPGGTAIGTKELADDVKAADLIKPVLTHFTDTGFSAAYWIGSAARSVSANLSASLGSLGTFTVVEDSSGAATMQGVKVHLVSTGKLKGLGTPGVEVTSEQIESVRALVETRNEFFMTDVSVNRRLPRAKLDGLATGDVFFAKESLSLGLIDEVLTSDEAFVKAQRIASEELRKTKKGKTMSNSDSIREIKAACPGVTDAFVLKVVEESKSIEAAAKEWANELAIELAASKEKITELEDRIKSLEKEIESSNSEPTAKIGVRPLVTTSTGKEAETSPTEAYWNKVKELQLAGKTRSQAMREVNALCADLRTAMVEEVNVRRKVKTTA